MIFDYRQKDPITGNVTTMLFTKAMGEKDEEDYTKSQENLRVDG